MVPKTPVASRAKLIKLPHVAHSREKRVAFHFQDLFKMAEIMKSPFVKKIENAYFSH